MFYIYILQSIIYRNRYIGSTEYISKRLKEHNAGKVRYTKGRKPWKLIYKEEFNTRSEARKRILLKSGLGRKFLDKII